MFNMSNTRTIYVVKQNGRTGLWNILKQKINTKTNQIVRSTKAHKNLSKVDADSLLYKLERELFNQTKKI